VRDVLQRWPYPGVRDRGSRPHARGSPRNHGTRLDLTRRVRVDVHPKSILLFTVALVLSFPGFAAGQGVLLDEGTFDLSIRGRPAGTEDFLIRRSGVGRNAQTIATAEVSISGPEGRLEMRPALQVLGEALAVSAYQTKVSGARQEEVFVTAGNGSLLLRIRSRRGEQERELRATAGMLVLDADVAHQHYFLSLRLQADNRPLVAVVPREGRLVQVTLVESEPETIQIGGQSVDSERLRLSIDQDRRDLWVDSEGKVLRVSDSASGYSAVRTALPSTGP
jgi:hypothetical protein